MISQVSRLPMPATPFNAPLSPTSIEIKAAIFGEESAVFSLKVEAAAIEAQTATLASSLKHLDEVAARTHCANARGYALTVSQKAILRLQTRLSILQRELGDRVVQTQPDAE